MSAPEPWITAASTRTPESRTTQRTGRPPPRMRNYVKAKNYVQEGKVIPFHGRRGRRVRSVVVVGTLAA